MKRSACAVALLCATAFSVSAQTTPSNLLRIDASASTPAPQPVPAHMGTARNPQGDVIGANSQYLTFDGKPWLPVMGEFHYSRYPAADWESEILKMKAAGVNIISTYVIWIHVEEKPGVFDWSGQRDLRRFVQLCAKHGMYVYPRIGPWSHGEVRNGGLPDWIVKAGHIRSNDPTYLAEVQTFYAQIAQQLRGELWKDGGPVIGIQIENEYNLRGPGQGAAHIRKLQQMAIADGLDVPLYTVTGWDGAAIPLNNVLPVFGGYPAAPWSGTPGPLPPSEIYEFRFRNRAAGNMGAIGGHGQNAASSYAGTPFLTAEVGSGIEDTYFRRPVVSADDIASIVPVLLGSGANMLGFYMFHGGRNPSGGDITLQESQRTGYPTDVPVRSYDFQAPIGEFGQERASLNKLKLTNYFLNDFGAELAPMAVHAPSMLPSSPSDTGPVRLAARTLGDRGFIFFNNYVRGLKMPSRAGFQVALKLPRATMRVPLQPITLPSNAYGIWPVNLRVGAETLRYSTAQLFKRVASRDGHASSFWFFALPGIAPEFLFAPGSRVLSVSSGVEQTTSPDGVRLRMSGAIEAEIKLSDGDSLIVLPEARAVQVWRGDDPSLLLATSAWAYSQDSHWTLLQPGDPHISFGIYGGTGAPLAQHGALTPGAADGAQNTLFHFWTVSVPPVSLPVAVQQVRPPQRRGAWAMGPKLSWRPQAVPLAPDATDFANAGLWRLKLPPLDWSPTLADAMLRIHYQGDVARLSNGPTLIDDNFWNGLPWEVGLRETEGDLLSQNAPKPTTTTAPLPNLPATTLDLRILPLPEKFPMYIQQAAALHFINAQAGSLQSVELVPVYRAVIAFPPR